MLLPYANVGGTERHVHLLGLGLSRLGIGVRVLLPPGPAVEAFQREGLSVRLLPKPSVLSMPAWIKAIRQEALRGASLVHVHAAMEMVWASRWAVRSIPRVFTAHGYHLELDYMKAGAMLNSTADRVIAVSHAEQARMLRYGLKPALTRVVHNGIDLQRLAGPPGTLAEELKLPPDSKLIGMVNRLDAYKGVEIALKAISLLRAEDPRLHLAIVGEGPERARFEAMARAWGVHDAVHWLGRREDLGDVLRSFDVFVTPTRKESFGMAVVEAMACGLPVLATDLPALREIMTHDVDGMLLPVEAGPATWANALLAVVRDPDRMRRYAVSARERSLAFGLDEMARKTREVYAEVRPAVIP